MGFTLECQGFMRREDWGFCDVGIGCAGRLVNYHGV